METRAQLNGIRLAPRKVRAVAALLRRKDVSVALDQLEHLIKKPSEMFIKLLKSAVANAENNSHMVADNLYIKNIIVDEGIKLRRWLPRAQGRATELQKKTSRITIVLDERVAGMKRAAAAKADKPEVQPEVAAEEKSSKAVKAPKVERELGKKGSILGNIGKKMFQRKSI